VARIGLEVAEEEQNFTCDPEGGVIVTELLFDTPMLAVQFLQKLCNPTHSSTGLQADDQTGGLFLQPRLSCLIVN